MQIELLKNINNYMKRAKLNKIITIEAGKRVSKPCIRGMRISVYDILGWLDSGMTIDEIIHDYPELNKRDIVACTNFAKDVSQKNYLQKI